MIWWFFIAFFLLIVWRVRANLLQQNRGDQHTKKRKRKNRKHWSWVSLSRFRKLLNSYRDFIVIDLETTGVGERAEVVEVVIMDSHGHVLLEQRVRPLGSIETSASKIHGITKRMLKDAPEWPEVHDQVSALLDGKLAISYNMEFDSRVLDYTASVWGLPQVPIRGVCAMVAYAEYRAVPHEWRRGEFKWHKLVEACKWEGIPTGRMHTGRGDAEATRLLALKLVPMKQ